jgi:hypothetical protein
LRLVVDDLARRSLSQTTKYNICSGEALELWCAKIALGLYYAAQLLTSENKKTRRTHTLDPTVFASALEGGNFHPPCGLYINTTIGLSNATKALVCMPLTSPDFGGWMLGLEMRLFGIALRVIFHPGATLFVTPEQGWRFRPVELVFKRQKRTHRIALTWPPGTLGSSITAIISQSKNRVVTPS